MSESIKKHGHFRRNWPFYTLFLIALGLSGFLWVSKTIGLKNQAKAFETEKVMLLKQADEMVKANAENQLELMMKTFSWAVRGEMTRGNEEQVDQYFKQLVKSEKIEEVTLVDRAGKILISTNKKNEGNQLAADYASAVMKVEETTIIDEGGLQIVAAPVMSLESRLGTLMVIYKLERFQLEAKIDLTENK